MTTNRIQTLRSSTAGARPAAGARAPGELYTNWPDLQFGVIDSSKNPVDLLAIRKFSASANYVVGDFVTQGGSLYRANTAVSPAAFNPAQWDAVALVTATWSSYLVKAGDTMLGPLALAADPTLGSQAATKNYVDNAIAAWAPPTPSVPPGTVMLFWQTAAPLGWTKLTTQNDKALRVVSGSGGVAGGSNPFSVVQAQTVVGNHTLTASEIPSISVSGSTTATLYLGGSSSNYAPVANAAWYGLNTSIGSGYTTPYTGTGISPGQTNYAQGTVSMNSTSTNTGGQPHNHGITMSMQYIDVILCSKN